MPLTVVGRHLLTGLAVHGGAAMVYIALSRLELEGCDTGDGLAASWGAALCADAVLAAVIVSIALVRGRETRAAVVAGWMLSAVPAIIAAALVMSYINSLPSGCE